MKCPNCGAEVREEDKFCGECGENLRGEIEMVLPPLLRKIEMALAPKWKWGSMIASLVLIFIFWIICMVDYTYDEELLLILLIFGLPATIYLMYKERTEKIKYGLAWILFPILTLLFGLVGWSPEVVFIVFLVFAIPAIVIDFIYVYKTR